MTIPDLSQNNEAVDGFLSSFVVPGEDDAQQHGVKGQKWGVRKDLVGLADLSPGGGTAIGKTRGSAELTKKEIKTVSSATQNVRNTLLDKNGMMRPNGPVDSLNKAHRAQYKNEIATPEQIKAYDKKFTAIAEAHANAVTPPGTVARVHLDGRLMLLFVGDKSAVDAAISDFKHDDLMVRFVVTRDDTGAITDIQLDSLAHAENFVDEFLSSIVVADEDDAQQHGVKGQKWGVSKAGVGGSSRSAQAKIGRAQAKQLLVDHAYAKRSAQLAGLSVAGIAAAALAPGLVPAAVIAAAGGATVLSAKIALAATVATRVGYAHNYLTYAKRAKARIGTVAHAAVSENRTVEQVYNDLDPAKKLAANLMIADTSRGIEFANDPEIQNGWSTMTELERSVVLFMASGVPSSDNVAHADATIDSVLEHAVKLGSKKGKPGHILFIARGSAPKVGTQFNHQGSSHEVIKVDTSSSDPKRHMITAKKVDAKTVAHSDLSEWESYLIEDDEDADYFEHHGIKGMKWGVRRSVDSATGRVEMTGSTGLNPRRGSADQIAQDRIQKKIDSVGVHALSTAELQSYSRRLQVEKDVSRVLAEQSAAQKAASQSFITKFVKKQAGRQTNRVIDKALDVAVEKALHEAGIKIGKKGGNPDAADLLVKTATRLAPKKGK